MSFISEFKKFAMRGNVLDLAIGIIIGGAFTPIVNSLVKDIIMPPIGIILGDVDFSNLAFTLKEATATAPAVAISYGLFINTVISFFIVAMAIFLIMKLDNVTRGKEEKEKTPTPPPVPTKEELLLTEIRDLLRNKK